MRFKKPSKQSRRPGRMLEALKHCFETVGGGLPSCEEELYQDDFWQVNAPDILAAICNEFNLYEAQKDA